MISGLMTASKDAETIAGSSICAQANLFIEIVNHSGDVWSAGIVSSVLRCELLSSHMDLIFV